MTPRDIEQFIKDHPEPARAARIVGFVAQMNYSAGYRAAATCQPIFPTDPEPPKKAS